MSSKPKPNSAINVFKEHGVILKIQTSQAVGNCPFCGAERKFYVGIENGGWDCKVCCLKGGPHKFLELKAKSNQELFRGAPAIALSQDRGIGTKVMRDWGIGWDGKQYTIPVNAMGKLFDLRRYQIGGKVMGSTGMTTSLIGLPIEGGHATIWVCEGEWDGLALTECMRKSNRSDVVISIPGAGTFPQAASDVFHGRTVNVALDHDLAGRRGANRIHRLLSGIAKTVNYIHWEKERPDGFDVRDLYKESNKDTIAILERQLRPVPPPVPEDFDPKAPRTSDHVETPKLDGKGLSEEEVIKRYRKHLFLPDPEVLAVMYGAVFANRLGGDPLWMFFVAPPGGSKTELLMSMADAPLIMTTTSLTPHALISGSGNSGVGDPSLIPKLNEKVLIVKDFTTILSMPAIKRDEIFGILRDAYDGHIEWHYGNGIHRSYDSRFGILAGVTPVIEGMGANNSMLGERFLKYRLTHGNQLKSGEAIILRAIQSISNESTMRSGLRLIANETLNVALTKENIPTLSLTYAKRITKLAQWVACLRGVVQRERYTDFVEFKPTREVGTRLAKQFAKLAMGVAIYRQHKAVEESDYQTVVSVARSTTPDRVEEIVKQLYLHSKEQFVSTKEIAKWTHFPTGTVLRLLQDLELLREVQKSDDRISGWRLTRTMLRMMRPLGLYVSEETWHSAKRNQRDEDE